MGSHKLIYLLIQLVFMEDSVAIELINLLTTDKERPKRDDKMPLSARKLAQLTLAILVISFKEIFSAYVFSL
jgi:hypothetical protein